jgi:metal-dependent amidase/aminoacylase/carboxypeptidase family protein
MFGMHNRPKLDVGKLQREERADDGRRRVLRHPTSPASGARGTARSVVDAALVAAQIAVSLQSIVSRNVAPLDSAVLSVTRIQGRRRLQRDPADRRTVGTVRAFSREVMGAVERQHAACGGGRIGLWRHRRGRLPRHLRAAVNDPAQAEFAARICTDLVGADKVDRNPPLIMASEDFSFMLNRCRAATSTSATAWVNPAARCTTPPTTSTTARCRWARPSSCGRSKRSWPPADQPAGAQTIATSSPGPALRMRSSPPCACATSRHRYRPSPTPPARRVRALSGR